MAEPPPRARRKELYPAEFPAVAAPVPLVAFAAVQQIVFLRAFEDRPLNRQPHREHSRAVALKPAVEARLVEVELAPVEKSVETCRRVIVEPEDVEPQPSTFQRQKTELAVKVAQIGRVERLGPPASAPADVVQVEHQLDGFAALLRRLDLREPDAEITLQPFPFAVEGVTMLRT